MGKATRQFSARKVFKSAKRVSRCLVATLLSFTMAFSPLVAIPRQAQAAGGSFSLGSCLGKVALSAVKGSLVWGLGEMADATSNDAVATVFSSTRALIAGKQRVLAERTIDMINQLSADLDALYQYTVTSSTDIENMIKNLTWKQAKDDFYVNAGVPVDNFTGQYKSISSEFNAVVEAFVAYNNDPSDDNKQKLEERYNTVYNNYFNGKSYDKLIEQRNNLFDVPLLGDANHTGFLSLISPYDPYAEINSTSDMADPSSASWEPRGGASVDTTYLGYYRSYLNTITNFQSNTYESMKDAATLVDNAAYLYLLSYRYYCEFQAMLFASDPSLSESEVRTQTTMLWDDFYTNAYRLIRGINQMYHTQEDVFSTYMRTSDVAMTRSIQNYQSPIPFDEMLHEYENTNGYDGILYLEHEPPYKTPTTKMYTNVIKQDQHIYQFRLVSDPSKVYAIRSSTNSSTEDNGVSRALYSQDLVMIAPTAGANDQTIPSTDVFTVLKGLEGGYTVPVSISELSAIAEGTITSYDTGKTMTDNIKSELTMAFGNDVHLPNVELHRLSSDEDEIRHGPNLMPLRTQLNWFMLHNVFQNPDGEMVLATASMPYDAGNQVNFDLEDDLRDHTGSGKDNYLQDTEAVVMWVCEDPSVSVTLTGSDGGATTMTVGDGQLGDGESGTFSPGTAMTIKAEPYDGWTISSIQLVDKDGHKLEDVFADAELNKTTTITTQEMLATMSPNAGGAYEFMLPVPCQDATVQVSYAPIDPSLLTYDVTLNDVKGDSGSYDAVMQFGSYDFLGTKSFHEGDQVVVSVIGYNNRMPKGITFADAGGNAVDVAYEDVTSQMKRTRPSERLYAFTMLAQDLVVSPILGTSNTVTVYDSANVTHTFDGLDLYSLGGNTDWEHAKAVDFAEGDTVSISYQVASGNTVTGIEVFDSSNDPVPTTPEDGRISFTMPAKDVTVRFSEKQTKVHARTLVLEPVEGQFSLQFVNKDGDDLNLHSKEFMAGDTVDVQVRLTQGDDTYFPEMVLTMEGGTDNVFAAQGGTYDSTTGKASFKMPDSNATLSATLTSLTPEEVDDIDTDEEGNVLIRTYEDLVKFSQAIRKRPDYYSARNLVLTNNINANGKDPWTQGIGSVRDGIYFNGTFEGNGYCIFGMDMQTDGTASLFEVVGEQGVVRNLFMFDCDCTVSASGAGGIAGVNYGRIEHCVNGVNLTNGVYVRPNTGELVSLKEYNSLMRATYAGGIVERNYGTVYACRNASEVDALYYGGGIAATNKGIISNCASNGKVNASASSQDKYSHYGAGGICAENNGTVEGGYSSASVSAADCSGNIAGMLYSCTTVDTYYTTSEDQQLGGDFYNNVETNVNGLTRGEMMTDSFVDMLSATGSNSVTWLRHNALNAGLPRIKNPSAYFADVEIACNGVIVSGNLHTGATMPMTSLASDSEAWKLLAKDADGYTPVAAYSCVIEDQAGNQIPAELWAQSALQYAVPVTSADVIVNVLGHDGTVRRVSDVRVEQSETGYRAVFTTDDAEAFMVLTKGSGTSGGTATQSSSKANVTGTVTKAKLPKTGERDWMVTCSVLLACAVASLMLSGMAVRRGKQTHEE